MPQLNPTFCRRLVLAHLIATLERPSVPALMARTQWPRRTIQDALKSLPDFGIQAQFIEDGVRHNDGYYRIDDWGAINPQWITQHWNRVCASLNLQP